MKPIILSDCSTELRTTKDIFVVNSEKSALGQIVYTLDSLSNTGTNIIYLSSHEYFPSIILASQKISSLHSKNSILVIDIDSTDNKENLIKNIIKSKDVFNEINDFECNFSLIKTSSLEKVESIAI